MQNTGLELERKIIISTDVNEVMAGEIIDLLLAINDFDETMASALNEYTPEPIEIFINSGGGSVSDGFAIIGAMEMCSTPIVTYGLGLVGSMALAIFMKGDVRISARHTRFMYHTVAYQSVGYIKDHELALAECGILQRMYDSLFEDTKISKEIMVNAREKKEDFFFSSKQAKELGVVHDILSKDGQRPKIEEAQAE